VVTAKGKLLEDQTLNYSAVPLDVARVLPTGDLVCAKSGDVNVVITGAGLSTTLAARCRMVGQVKVDAKLGLILGNEPVKVAVEVLDNEGKPLTDVPVQMRSDDEGILRVKDGMAAPVAMGQTVVHVSVGARVTDVAAVVIERVTTDTLAIPDGGSRTCTLTQGRYIVESNVRATDGSAYGVTWSWVGVGCANEGEARHHVFACEVPNTASLVVTNPTGWGMGPSETGNVSVYRVPAGLTSL
jgi:hypothetical protein